MSSLQAGDTALLPSWAGGSAASNALPTGRGNEAAQKGHYAEAVQAFTEAVKLNPREHR